MRNPNEFRTFPPIDASAGWGTGSKDTKKGNERRPVARAFVSGDERTGVLLLACCWRRRPPFPPRVKASGARPVRRCNGY